MRLVELNLVHVNYQIQVSVMENRFKEIHFKYKLTVHNKLDQIIELIELK